MIVCGSKDNGALNYFRKLNSLSSLNLVQKDTLQGLNNCKPELVITGAALGENIDKELIRYAKREKITSISVVENWTWYRKRFESSSGLILPDFILLNDIIAKEDAIKDGLPSKKLKVMGNPVLESLFLKKSEYAYLDKHKTATKKNILFISEQLRQDFRNKNLDLLGFDEYEVVSDLLQILKMGEKLTVKLHPAEDKNKYKYLDKDINIIKNCEITHILESADVVVGMQSMLLIELAVLRGGVISYRPNAKTNFFGERIGATIAAESKDDLRQKMNDPYKNISNFAEAYLGSSERIENFIGQFVK